MRLESALYASREGLNANGQAISVVGDNISNSNTTGFKKSRVEFADLFAGSADSGTVDNTDSFGDGVKVGSVRVMQDTGVIEFTGRTLDVGIAGEGFFVVNNGTSDFYSRAGNFNVDSDGFLVDAKGNFVMGYPAAGGTTLTKINMRNADSTASPTTSITLSGNLDARDAVGTVPTAPTKFSDILANGAATFRSDVTVYDSLGESHNIALAFTKTDALARTWTAQAYIDGKDVNGGTEGVPQLIGTYTGLTFNESGVIPEANRLTSKIDVSGISYKDGAAAGAFSVNLGGFSQFATAAIVNGITNNGKGTGNIQSYEFQKDGSIIAVLDSGVRKSLGTVAIADFINVDGLDRVGNALYTAGTEAGAVSLSKPGAAGVGTIEGGALERSTVDIASEFTDLVIFQRAYQANSQTLNAANSLIRDTLGLIR